MGSPISPVITNIFMECFKKKVLRKTLKKSEVWFHYVDIRDTAEPNFVNSLFSSTIDIQISTSL